MTKIKEEVKPRRRIITVVKEQLFKMI